MVSHPEHLSMQNHNASEAAVQADVEKEQLRQQVAHLEQACAVLQAEVKERHRCEQGLQRQVQDLTQTLESLGANPRLNQFSDQVEAIAPNTDASSSEHGLLETTALVANALLTITNSDEAVNTALQIIGKALETDRVAVIKIFNVSSTQPPRWQVLYEWDSLNTVSQIAHPNLAQGTFKGLEEWHERLSQGQSLSYLLEEMPEPFRRGQAELGVKALHLIPIFLEGKFWGTVGCDDCREAKRRSSAELSVLRIAADCIGSAIQQQQTQQALLQAEQARSAELEKVNNALKRSLDSLASEPSLDKFLGQVLTAIAEQLQAPQVEYWYHPTADFIYIGMMSRQSTVYSQDEIAQLHPNHPGIAGVPTPVDMAVEPLEQRRQYFIRDNFENEWYRECSEQFALGLYQELNLPMVLGETNIGALVIRVPRDRQFTTQQIELAQALTHQATLAAQLTRLAEAAQQAAIAREQEEAAQERAAELARSNEALQQTIDTLGSLSSFEEFIPAVLRIVAQTFNATDCGYYEHSQDETVYLRYWFSQETVLNPMELQLLDPQQHPVLLRIINGFTVPPEHLHGTTVRDRTRSVVIDHTTANTVPEFHAFAVSQGWELELNQPLLVEGKADGALIVYRKLNQPFTEAEIMLAEALAKQLALAMQASRLSDQARDRAVETAIAREQEKAAQERAAELAKANEELQQRDRLLSVVAQISKDLLKTQNLEIAVPAALQVVGETLTVNRVALILERKEPSTERLQHYIAFEWVDHNTRNHHSVGLSVMNNEDFQTLIQPLYQGSFVELFVDDVPEVTQEKFRALGIQSTGITPIFIEANYIGCLAFSDCTIPRHWTQQEIDVLTAIADSIGAALHRKQLVDRLVEERIQAEQERVTELAKANLALQRSVEKMSQDFSPEILLSHVLVEAVDLSGANGGGLFIRQSPVEAGFCPIAIIENGVLRSGEDWLSQGEIQQFVERSAIDETGFFKQLSQGKINYLRVDEPDELWWDDSITYHRQLGYRVVMHVPMMLHGEVLGAFALCFKQVLEPKPEIVEYLTTLANQATLALELTRLAEEAKQAAVAREQEEATQKHAAELAKANGALRRGIERLAASGTLDTALDAFLLEAMSVTGAAAGAVMKRGIGSEFVMQALAQDGEVIKPFDPHSTEELYRERTASDPTGVMRRTAAGEIVILPIEDIESWFPEAAAYHRNLGHRTVWHIPFRVNGEVGGYLGLAFCEEKSPSGVLRETVQTLAHQISLALQAQLLANHATQAAIAREQEKAALERARELEETNALLSRSMRRLASEASPDAFVVQLHHELCELIGGAATAQFRLNWEAQRIIGYVIVENGRILDDNIASRHIDLHLNDILAWRDNLREDSVLRFDVEQDAAVMSQSTVQYMRECGFTWLVNLPLFVQEQPSWVVAVAGHDESRLTERNLELFCLLSRQLTLALELRQLAEEAEQAAIAREQEKAAQERAAELEKANQSLAHTAAKLAEQGDLTHFFDELLLETARQLNANSAHLVVYDNEQRRYNSLHMHSGNVQSEPELPAFFRLDELSPENFHTIAQRERRPHWYDAQADAALFSPGASEYLSRAGLRSVLHVPLVVGEQIVGGIGFAFHSRQPEVGRKQALVEALAHQAALAIQLMQLAEEAQQVAIAREQEKAAQERAAELAKANEALRRSARKIAQNASIEDILPLFLCEAIAVSSAAAGASEIPHYQRHNF